MVTSQEIRLAKRPDGMPTEACFEFAHVDLPDIQDGEILIKNLWLTVDPYMRGRMDDTESYVPPFQIGQAMEGGAIGQVVESKNADFAVGEIVESMAGWREYFIADADMLSGQHPDPMFNIHKREAGKIPLQAYLGIAGMPGMTAYTGIELIAKTSASDTVFVSGAAGAVGSTVCQIAKIKGATVIGSAGSEDKIQWLKDVAGVDHVINYKATSDLSQTLREHAPNGIDVYFENVGGAHLTAAIENMNMYGRIALCGMISEYNSPSTRDDSNLFMEILTKEIMVKGFIVTSYYKHYPEFISSFSEWLANGQVSWEETVLEGIENMPAAFLGLFSGRNMGKMLVKLADPA